MNFENRLRINDEQKIGGEERRGWEDVIRWLDLGIIDQIIINLGWVIEQLECRWEPWDLRKFELELRYEMCRDRTEECRSSQSSPHHRGLRKIIRNILSY